MGRGGIHNMAKIRLTRISIVEYEPEVEYYPNGSTFEDMARIDANADDREALFIDCVSDEITWEIIED